MAVQYRVPATTFDSVLVDASIDGVSLATPAESHARLAERAIAAGKHVYVEKPLALDPEDARRVIAAAENAGVRLMVGHLLPYHPVFNEARRITAAGELGALRYVYFTRLTPRNTRAGEKKGERAVAG